MFLFLNEFIWLKPFTKFISTSITFLNTMSKVFFCDKNKSNTWICSITFHLETKYLF